MKKEGEKGESESGRKENSCLRLDKSLSKMSTRIQSAVFIFPFLPVP